VNHHTSPSFWAAFEELPTEIQALARANYELLRENPRHPSLHFKKVGENWSVRVGLGYRARNRCRRRSPVGMDRHAR